MRTSEFQKNPVDEIVVQTLCTLQVPWGWSGRKKDMAQGMVQPHNPKAMYNGKPIQPNYALVDVAWTHNDYEEDELDFPTKDGVRFISVARALEQGRHFVRNADTSISALATIIVSPRWPK